MSFKIDNANEIDKLLAFIRAAAKGRFEVDPALVQKVFGALKQFAKENNIAVEVVNSTGQRVAFFTGAGVITGAALGLFALAHPSGVFVAAMAGGVVGLLMAHVKVRISQPPKGSADPTVIELV